MIKILKVSLVILMGSSVLLAGQIKLYDVKSGKVEYEIKGSGEIMGSKMQTVGKKRVIFDDNGAKNLTEENKIEKQSIMGQKNVTKTHTMTYMKSNMLYEVSFDNRRIIRMGNMGAGMAMLMGGGKDMKQTGEAMLKQMGGKKMGTDQVLGYTCDVWDLMGIKQCMYKGIPLRIESNMMGIKSTEVAIKAAFDISLSSSDFKLPDFPIYDMEGNKLDKSKLDVMDKISDEKLSKDAEKLAEMSAIFAEEMQKVGINTDEQPTTKAQEKNMEKGMENAVFLMIQKQMLDTKKAVEFGKECYTDVHTVQEANSCTHKMDKMLGENSDPGNDMKVWNDKTKKETLGHINKSFSTMECIEKTKNMKEMNLCMPKQ